MVFRIIETLNVLPYIPFKHNTKEPDKNSPEIWNKMFLYFRDNKEEFMKHYHKRSNSETVFSMIKLRLGEHLKCKIIRAQRNELMMKFICHNICCLIEAIYEHGVSVDFEKSFKLFVDRKVEDPYPEGALRDY